MVLGKKWPFFWVFFLGNIGQENVFTIFQNVKTPFQPLKKRSSKSRKIEIFPKGLTHGFGQKMAIFPCFFFQAIEARKMSFTIFQNLKTPFQPIKKEVQKVEKLRFFLWLWSKNGHFFVSFFQAIQARKMFFTIFQNVKTPFQPIKKRSLESRKIEIFKKGLTHCFGQKMAIFLPLFFRQYRPGKCFYNILERKNAFLALKKKNFKKSKN